MKIDYFVSFIFSTLLLSACTSAESPKNNQPNGSVVSQQDSIVPPPKEVPEQKLHTYEAWAVKGNDSIIKQIKALSTAEQKVLHVLNRVDKKHIGRIDTIVVPKQIDTQLLSYAPFPEVLGAANDIPKLVFFSYPIQAYALYEYGKLHVWGPTNMGKKATPTPTGLFFANWRGKEVRSSVDQSWILKWNFNISNMGGVGWHEYDLPGYPASHSCLRLLAEDAKYMYDWADAWILQSGQLQASGTPTIVFGEYPWGERRPWKSLLEDPKSNDISTEQLEEILQTHLPKIKKEQEKRQEVINARTKQQELAKTTTP